MDDDQGYVCDTLKNGERTFLKAGNPQGGFQEDDAILTGWCEHDGYAYQYNRSPN